MLKFKMAAISTTATRIGGGSKVQTITTACGKFKYKHYTSGGANKTTRHGVGIITPAETCTVAITVQCQNIFGCDRKMKTVNYKSFLAF